MKAEAAVCSAHRQQPGHISLDVLERCALCCMPHLPAVAPRAEGARCCSVGAQSVAERWRSPSSAPNVKVNVLLPDIRQQAASQRALLKAWGGLPAAGPGLRKKLWWPRVCLGWAALLGMLCETDVCGSWALRGQPFFTTFLIHYTLNSLWSHISSYSAGYLWQVSVGSLQ